MNRRTVPERVWQNQTASGLLERGLSPPKTGTRPKRLFRVLYDSEKTDELHGNRFRTGNQVVTLDTQGTNVWNYFGDTFSFYYEVFGRNSIDDLGMSMVGSIRFDDEQVSFQRSCPPWHCADRLFASLLLGMTIQSGMASRWCLAMGIPRSLKIST
jgi:hypothetical protein